MDYGFTHEGKVFTPNGTTGVDAGTSDDRNKAIEQEELATWETRPDRMFVYYHFPRADTDGRRRRETFFPQLTGDTSNGNGGSSNCAIVTTWLGTKLGQITSAQVYLHNFGGRFVSLRVKATNGAEYYGRASYDWGQCVTLRKVKR